MNSIRQNARNTYAKWLNICLGIKRNKVLFQSFGGRTYSDNPRAISEALHEQRPDVDIVWAFKEPEKKADVIPDYIRTVDITRWKKYAREFSTAKIIVNNTDYRIPKMKGQYLIQTWHGDRAFKKILYDSPSFRKRVLRESLPGYCDIALAGSQYGVNVYHSAFHYNGEILLCGSPRNDVLVHPNLARASLIRERIGINPDLKILLYAPTFRDNNRKNGGIQQIQNIDIDETLTYLDNKYQRRWICLMRAHPGISKLTGFIPSDRIVNVSNYEDMADLLLISDMLITDYSSSAGDYALLNRPVILYQPDRQAYISGDRPLYFKIEDSPFMVAEDQKELNDWIRILDDKMIYENCRNILQFYETTETGEAAIIVARMISDQIDKRKSIGGKV